MVEVPEELEIRQKFPNWYDWIKPIRLEDIKHGIASYIALPKQINSDFFKMPFGDVERDVFSEDWKLPENWKEIFLDAFRETLDKNRAFKLFLDICVRCGACGDKCHYYLGTGDPKNMPVMRAEVIRTVYRYYFTKFGRLFGKFGGARPVDENVIKEWYYYLYQCTLCRRCGLFCPYGIDNAEIIWWARRILQRIGLHQRFMCISIEASARTGNHLGLYPGGMVGSLEMACDELKDITGFDLYSWVNKKGADVLFVPPSGDYFAVPHWYTFLGYIVLFNELENRYGITVTWSTYASEGGNFGTFHSYEAAQLLNSKIYKEAKRLGVKFIIGGECGHMWRDKHQFINTMNVPPDHDEWKRFWEDPDLGQISDKLRGIRLDEFISGESGWIHVLEFVAALIHYKKLDVDKSRNDHWRATLHDPCNLARGVGMLDEQRFVLRNVMNHFYEMPEHTIREKTYCCAAGGVYLGDEMMELRVRGCLPRMMALRYVVKKYGVNIMLTPCAIDRAQFPHMLEYWKIPAEIGGICEMVGNAIVLRSFGEKPEDRKYDMRGTPIREEE
ncbi:MAG: (Fe-S)-binding protein [Archaeoglobales archaeon]|nr:MAG: (Fe-S)-binding protein [Archaeoglobales archaeon]